MATHDDRQWILSLVQNAYVTTDDTGLCEMIFLTGEEGRKHVAEYSYLYEENEMIQCDSEDHPLGSPDIDAYESSAKFSSYRPQPTNDKINKEWKAASRAKKVTWKYNADVSEVELCEMFQRKAVIKTREKQRGYVQSTFSHLIETHQEDNPFVWYSQFDGRIHSSRDSREVKIYVYDKRKRCNDYPLKVRAVKDAKVEDIIGLVCWIYTKNRCQPPLKNVDDYELYMAEEDGGVEFEFTPLERKDLMEKFEFPTLALVETDKSQQKKISVTVHFAKTFSVLELEHDKITLKELLDRAICRHREIIHLKGVGFGYHLEKEDEPGVALDMKRTVGDVHCSVFAGVRDHSKRSQRYSARNDCVSAAEVFFVTWEKRLARFETKIDICEDTVFFHPLNARGSSGLLFGAAPHPVTYPTSALVDCTNKLLSKNRTEIELTIEGENSFKHYKFICEPCEGDRLYKKCQHLLRINLKKDRKPVLKRRNSLSVRRRSAANSFHREI